MGKVSCIVWVSVLALLIGGCQPGRNTEQGEPTTPKPTPVASPDSTKPSPPVAEFAPKSPETPEQEKVIPIPPLITTLPSNEVRNRIDKGRLDPFAAISVQPEVEILPNPGRPSTSPTRVQPLTPAPRTPGLRSRPGTGGSVAVPPSPSRASRPSPSRASRPSPSRSTRPDRKPPSSSIARKSPGSSRGNVLPRPQNTRPTETSIAKPASKPDNSSVAEDGIPPIPPEFDLQLPILPEPELANNVSVTGVVDNGRGVYYAILDVPNEPSRSVQVGQFILGGQVLVKRIEMYRGLDPVVILEENGVEVSRRVGENSGSAS
ncbi:MAG: hypothetical protein F6J94_07255 [Moorea sp. SIO1F2]|uniref:hypothetical protein n=1 Tax=Moorena sp. SIO1F2 TaxID=2607819 RepID=UPI0013BE3279|nr:hypothetical protein [Moorena sp. SIO1F2]NET81758.1 hypothetical protein [Moorena sp. SIO1F2]